MINGGNNPRHIKIGQMSDLHLGYRQYGKFERATDFFKYAKVAAELLISKEPDIVLIPGDIYHRERPYPIDHRQALQIFKLFQKAKIPVCVIRGNHDANFAWSKRHKGDVLHVLHELGYVVYLEDSVEEIRLSSGESIRVWGLGCHGTEISLKLEKLVNEFGERLQDKGTPNVLLIHDYLDNMVSSSRVSEALLTSYGFEYVAVGHSHKWWANKKQTVCCTGSTEHVSSDEWHEPNRSVAIITLSNDGRRWKSSVERLIFAVRPKRNIRLELGTTTAEEAIKTLKDVLRNHDEQDVMIKIHVKATLSDTQQTIDVSSAAQITKNAFHIIIVPEINYSGISISDEFTLQEVMEQVFVENLGVSKRMCTKWTALAENMKEVLTGSFDSRGEATAVDLLYDFVSSTSSKSKPRRKGK